MKTEVKKTGKTWGFFINGELIEGGFFEKKEAETAAKEYKPSEKAPEKAPKKAPEKAPEKKKEEPVPEKINVDEIDDEALEKEFLRRKQAKEEKEAKEKAEREAAEAEDRKKRTEKVPEGACDHLQNLWLKGIFGGYDPDSIYCEGDGKGEAGCIKEAPQCYVICKANTEDIQLAKSTKSSSPKGPKPAGSSRSYSPSAGVDAFGQRIGSKAANFNALLLRPEGATKEQLRAERGDWSRRMKQVNLFGALHGMKIIQKGDKYYAVKNSEVTTA